MPDKLPKGWAKTTLGEIRRAASLGISQKEMLGENFELYSVPAFSEGKPEVVTGDRVGSNKVVVASGDVLICKINPRINRAWVVAESSGPRQIASTEWIVFSKQEGIVSEFLRYFFTQDIVKNYLAGNVSGVGGSLMRVRPAVVEKIPLNLPPTREQERIVAKLDALLSRVAAGEAAACRALNRLQRHRAAVLQAAVTGELTRNWRRAHPPEETGVQLLKRLLAERRARWEAAELKRLRAVGKPPKDDKWKKRYSEPEDLNTNELTQLPRGWTWAGLQQLGFIIGGLTKNPRRASLRTKLPYLRVGNVYANELRLDEVKTIGVEKEELEKLLVEKGDLLIVEGNGSKDQIGRLAIWDGSIEKCVHQNHIIKVRLVEKALGTWILSWLLSPPGRRHIEKVASSTTGLYTLSVSKVGNLPIPLPPFREQTETTRQLEHRLAASERLTTTLNRQLERAKVTRQSLLREAFAGNLVPQNPNDEPAFVLLERIRAAREAEPAARKLAKKSRPTSVPKPPKEANSMNQPFPTTDQLQKAWQKIGRKTDAKKLFEAAGFALEQVADFYGLLRTARDIIATFKSASKAPKVAPKSLAVHPKQAKQKLGQFRLASLWLEDFKNLKNYNVNFETTHGLDVVLGWNGTGKSNLFEALVIIFRDLHYWWEKNKWTDEPMAGYRLEYEIEGHFVRVEWNPSTMKRPAVHQAKFPIGFKGKTLSTVKRENILLPKFVFGYYSGPTNRLAEHFLPMKRDHYERLRTASSDDPETLARLLEQRRFFCAETHHAKYVLLAFSYKEDPKIWSFLERRLRIVGFESVLFVIRKPRWAKGKPEDFWGATGIMRRVMEKLRRYAIAPMVLKQKVADGYRLPSEELYYFFLPDLKSLHEFAAEYADARSFFLALESTDFSELIYDVKIQVRVKAANNKELSVTFRELSEGEQQLLMVLGLMRFTKSHQSLILLDEPDTHLNPHWSVEYLKDLASVVSDNDKPSPEQQTSQLLMATHDPLVIASLVKEQVHLLKRDAETLSCHWEQASVNPKGLGFTGILTSEMFGFRSDLDPDTLADLDNRVRLVAKEGNLSDPEKKQLEGIDKRLAEAGFSKAFSDPYYATFVRAWGKRYAEQMAGKEVLTKKDTEEIDRIAKEVLAEAVAEVEKEAEAHALH